MKAQIIIYGIAVCLFKGCASETTSKFIPVEGKFGYVTHVSGFTDQSLSASFCYRNTNGTTTVVWPHLKILWGNDMVITNDVALLVGGKSALYLDGHERLTKRLILFKGPSGPPMDITDQILQKYYVGSGYNLTNFMWDSFASLVKTNDSVKIDFVSDKIRAGTKDIWDPFDSSLIISWHDIESIMADVKKNGKLKKEKQSGFEYLQKE